MLLQLTESSKRIEEGMQEIRRGHTPSRSETLMSSDNAEDAMRVIQLVRDPHVSYGQP